MTRTFLFCCFLLSLVTLCPARLPVIDFSQKQPETRLHSAQERQQQIAYEPVQGRDKALRVQWTQTRGGHFEFAFADGGTPTPTFTKATFHVQANFPKNHSAKYFNLRLCDKLGIIFQFRHPVDPNASGWQQFNFDVDTRVPYSSCWGGRNTKPPVKLTPPVKVFGFACDYQRAETDTHSNWTAIGDISCTVLEDYSSPVFRLHMDSPLHLLLEKDGVVSDDAPRAILDNQTNRVASGELTITVRDHLNNVVKQERKQVTLQPRQQLATPLDIPQEYAIRYVTAHYTDRDPRIQPVTFTRSYARIRPVGPTPGRGKGFLFGVCSHPQRHPSAHQELEAQAAALAGAKIMREDIHWGLFQPKEDTWNFGPFDYCVDTFGKYGIELEAIYSYCAPWAVAKDWKPIRPDWNRGKRPDYQHWARFISKFAERYRGKVHYVEVWNEPELFGFANFTAEEYVELMKIAYAETKKAAPEMTVLTAGFTTYPALARYNDPLHMEKSLTLGRGSYDIHAFHGHGGYEHYKRTIKALLDIRRELKVTAPWYANETAVSAAWKGELVQAHTLIQKLIFSWANGSIGYNWYDLRNDGFDPKDGEHNFGLITHDFHPKAAYLAYAMLARYFTEATFKQVLDLKGEQDAFVFLAKNGDMLIPFWNMDGSIASRLLALRDIQGQAFLIDPFGNETPLTIQNHTLVLNITNQPAILRLTSQQNIPVPAEFFAISRRQSLTQNAGNSQNFAKRMQDLFVVPGQTTPLAFSITNPTTQPLDAAISLKLPQGITAKTTSQTVSLQPGECRKLEFQLGDDHLSQAATILATASLGTLWSGEFPIAVNPIHVIPTDGGRPAFILDSRAQNTKLVPEAGDLQHLTWSGPQDCSARFWLEVKPGHLVVTATVTDDHHVQPYSGYDVWKGDNIQMAICNGSEPYFEFGLTHKDDNSSEVFVFSAPKGAKPVVKLTTSRHEASKTTLYIAAIQLDTLGITPDIARNGFLFNAIVNDNDGDTREGYMAIAPGIGTSKNVRLFPVIKLKD